MARGIEAGYDSVKVLFGVDFDIDDGEMVAVLGTNGAGKSTLVKALCGLITPTAGEVLFDGQPITTLDTNRIVRQGIAMVPGDRGIFPGLTTAENLRMAGWLYDKDTAYVKQATKAVLGYFPALERRLTTQAGSLSGGEQQMLSLAMAFVAQPRLMIIDELSLGLAPTVIESLLEIVTAINERGTAVILVEQSVNLALRMTSRATFMEKGQVVFQGTTADLIEHEEVVRSVLLEGARQQAGDGSGMAGRERAKASSNGGALGTTGLGNLRVFEPGAPQRSEEAGVVLAASGIVKRFGGIVAVDGVSLELNNGEILGTDRTQRGRQDHGLRDHLGPAAPDRRAGRDVRHRHQRLAGLQTLGLRPRALLPGGPAVAGPDRRGDGVAGGVPPGEVARGDHRPCCARPPSGAPRSRWPSPPTRSSTCSASGTSRTSWARICRPGSAGCSSWPSSWPSGPRWSSSTSPRPASRRPRPRRWRPCCGTSRTGLRCSLMLIEHDMGLTKELADRIIALDTGAVVAVRPARRGPASPTGRRVLPRRVGRLNGGVVKRFWSGAKRGPAAALIAVAFAGSALTRVQLVGQRDGLHHVVPPPPGCDTLAGGRDREPRSTSRGRLRPSAASTCMGLELGIAKVNQGNGVPPRNTCFELAYKNNRGNPAIDTQAMLDLVNVEKAQARRRASSSARRPPAISAASAWSAISLSNLDSIYSPSTSPTPTRWRLDGVPGLRHRQALKADEVTSVAVIVTGDVASRQGAAHFAQVSADDGLHVTAPGHRPAVGGAGAASAISTVKASHPKELVILDDAGAVGAVLAARASAGWQVPVIAGPTATTATSSPGSPGTGRRLGRGADGAIQESGPGAVGHL